MGPENLGAIPIPIKGGGTIYWYLIHGAVSTRLTWTRQLSVLPNVSRASLPALANVSPENLIEAWADWCLDDMQKPGIVMGHSMGGAIAQTMALKSPDMVLGLVLVGTGAQLPVNPLLIANLENRPEVALKQIMQWSLTQEAPLDLVSKSLKQALAYDPARAVREFMACQTFDVRPHLTQIKAPKALIAADHDRMTPIDRFKDFQEAWPTAPLYTVKSAGHLMMLEQPTQFNAILTTIRSRREFGNESTIAEALSGHGALNENPATDSTGPESR